MNKDEFKKDDTFLEDEREVDTLFDSFKNTKLKQAVKRAKRHSVIRNIVISVLVLVVVYVGATTINVVVRAKTDSTITKAIDCLNTISAPNTYIGKVNHYYNFLSGENEYTTYKLVEGQVVFTGNFRYSYGLFQNYRGNLARTDTPAILSNSVDVGSLDLQRYNYLGQREMVFFYPFIEYSQYKNDFELLEDIPDTKVMEMALSFDTEYSIEEVQELIPSDVTLSWYWIDDLSNQEKENILSEEIEQESPDGTQYTIETDQKIRSENDVYGLKAYDDEEGIWLENPEENFIRALKRGMKFDTELKSQFEQLYSKLAGENNEITEDDFRIFGVVVTGDAESLQSLQDLPFITASSLGVVVDKY